MDREVVRRAQRGDPDAFASLVRATGDWLFALAYRILRDSDRADDAVQETLEMAWRDLPMLRDPDRFEAWLRRVHIRVCYEEARRTRRIQSTVRLLTIDPVSGDDSSRLADRDQLEKGFRHLSPEQRVILVLHHYLGLEPAEMAEVLDIPAGTVRSRLHYAHLAMRAALAADARLDIALEARP